MIPVLRIGDVVTVRPERCDSPEDATQPLVVVEPRGDRCLVRWLTPLSEGGLYPTRVELVTDLQVIRVRR